MLINRYHNGQWINARTNAVISSTLAAHFGSTANGLVVSFNGSASVGGNASGALDYAWDFGDASNPGSGAITNHTYLASGTYSVTLTVTDSIGASNSTTSAVTVKSAAVEYLADNNPIFTQFVHPAAGSTVAQCIIRSPDTGQWFMSQVHQESTPLAGNTESTRISRMAADGTLIDQMLCTYGGHGTSMGLEFSNGAIYIWLTYQGPASGSTRTNDIVRFPYTAGTFTRAQITGLQVKIPGGVYRRIQFDWKNGYAILTEDPTWRRFRIADILSGVTTTPVNTISVTVNPPTLQGICTYGDSAFYYTGDGADTRAEALTNPGGPIALYEVSWKTGARVTRIDLSLMLTDSAGNYVGGHVEPESLTLYDPGTGTDPILNFGLISGPAGTPHTYYVYQFDLVNQTEALANRPFALRDTRPTAANVGAGILRPVTAVHNGDLVIATAGTVLKDTTVNGSLTIQAANVVVENCVVKGPTVNPGTATVNPVFLVNTDNTAVATGPVLIRYSTITGGWKSPNVYGVGDRNYTLEFCDISKVVEAARATAAVTNGDANVVIRGNYVHDLVFYSPDPTNPTPVGATNVAGQSLSGAFAGQNWNWSSGVHLLNTNSTGIAIYGNNIVANWSADPAISSTPLPPAYTRLNAIRITGGAAIAVEDNWLDGGEQCVYVPGSAVTGSIVRNRFGRGMAASGTADSAYYALVVASANMLTNDTTLDRNVWQDSGRTVFRNGPASPPPSNDRSTLVAGTYIPDASTTGLLPGFTKTQLRVVTGSNGVLALNSGDLYENCWIQARVLKPTTGTATLRNCFIDGGSYNFGAVPITGLIDATGNNAGGIVVDDCHLEPRTPGLYGNGITGFNYAIRRSHIRHVVDGGNVQNTASPAAATNVLIEACYVHDLAYFTPDPTHTDNHSHNDAVQIFGGTGTRLHGNNLQAAIDQSVAQGGQSVFGANASGQAVGCTPTQSVAITGIEVWENYLDGGQQSFTAIVGNGPTGQNLGYIHDNQFGHTQVSKTEASDLVTRKRPLLIDSALVATDISPLGAGISKVDSSGNTFADTGTAITDYVMANAT